MGEPSPDEQKAFVKGSFDQNPLSPGDKWYLVSSKWYQVWKKYVGWYDVGTSGHNHPGDCDNNPLLTKSTKKLRSHLMEDIDYALVPADVWAKFQEWFHAEPEIERQVITVGRARSAIVEVYPLSLKVVRSSDNSGGEFVEVSKSTTIAAFKETLCKKYELESEKTRLWNYYAGMRYSQLDKGESTLEEARIVNNQQILIEVQNEDGTWANNRPTSSTTAASRTTTTSTTAGMSSAYGYTNRSGLSSRYGGTGMTRTYGAGSSVSRPATYGSGAGANRGYSGNSVYSRAGMTYDKGLMGLSNLGNTCFMNSGLQCLSNCVPLTNYFLSDEYVAEINTTNPLGMEGKVATSYADLVKMLWSGKGSAVAPRDFKWTIGKFAPRFVGFQQQDSQELVSFLLDGLHEDLNRCVEKPYVENIESDGRPDEVVATEAWEGHLKRNNSKIVDLFQGQLKSEVICPIKECGRVSITFDPFMYLSVPLPTKTEKNLPITVVWRDYNRKPTKFSLTINKNASIRSMCKELSVLAGIGPERMLVTEVYQHKFLKSFSMTRDSVAEIRDDDVIVVYEVEPVTYDDDDSDSDDTIDADADGDTDMTGDEEAAGLPVAEAAPAAPRVRYMHIPILHRVMKTTTNRYNRGYGRGVHTTTYTYPTLHGLPLILSVPTTTTTAELEAEILRAIGNFYTPPEEVAAAAAAAAETEAEDAADSPEAESGAGDNADQETDTSPGSDNDDQADVATDDEEDPASAGARTTPADSNGDGEADEAEEEEEEEEEDDGYGGRAYRFKIVNNVGRDIGDLPGDDEAVVLRIRQHVAVDWNPALFESCLDTDAMEEAEWDASAKGGKDGDSDEDDTPDTISIMDCLKLFTQREILSEEDPWYCSNCQEHRQASKKFDVWRTSDVLVFHLKRFQYTRDWREKLDTLVSFPLEGLDMSEHVVGPLTEPAIYDLFAVSNHFGGLGGGHYTAYGKNKTTGQWYHFDDSSVSKADESEIQSRAAYLLFYVRRGANMGASGSGAGGASEDSDGPEEGDEAASAVTSTADADVEMSDD